MTERRKKKLLRWRDNPTLFAREALGIDLWERQAALALAVRDHDYVACRSGHKIGKSCVAAEIALWAVVTHPDWRVVFTAPASHQVEHILWPELRRLYLSAKYPLSGRLYKDHHKGLVFREHWEVFGLTTDKPERFAGLSARGKLIFIVDEASGFPEAIFESVFGNMAGGAKVLLLGNPTKTSGTFYKAFHQDRALWKTLHIDSRDSPNIKGGKSIPGLATLPWVERWLKRCGGNEQHPSFQVRVAGNFPTQSAKSVNSLSLIEEARARDAKTSANEEDLLELGVDVARFGDDESVVCPRRGRKTFPLRAFSQLDEVFLAGKVLEIVRELRRDPDEVPRVKIDVTGIGAGVASILKRSDEVEVVEVNAAERSDDPDLYHSMRDQLWFAGKTFLEEGGSLPEDEQLEAELVAPEYDFDARGRYVVQSKDEMKAVLGRSPDRADAFNLSVYSPARESGGVVTGRSRWSR